VEPKVVDLGPLVSRTFPLAEAAEAFKVAATRQGLKVVVVPAPSGQPG
jgi:threonine dehydrogenase-like Zn-dependent dehydrogenase